MAGQDKTMGLLKELGVEDLYGFLGVQPDSTEKQINRAYRKKALKYHPDKNPDDPTAAEMFHRLSQVLAVLTDPVARASYDRWQKAKLASRRRHEELTAKRRKLKEQLEERESQQASTSETVTEREAAASMKKEIERLREETQRRIQEQTELLRQQMARGVSPAEEGDEDIMPTIKVTWRAKKSDATNGGYSQSVLETLFSHYGPLHHVLISSKRKGKALISFHSGLNAQAAVEKERGMPACPLTVSWVCGQPSNTAEQPPNSEEGEGESGASVTEGGCDGVEGRVGEDRDYESIVLMKLRQAEERKRLCNDLAKAEEDS